MSDLIDFSNCEKTKKNYEGANGSKICIKYNGELYMLKFPPASTRNKELSYTNGTVSEYIGCHILESLGFETQKTILGIYNNDGKKKTHASFPSIFLRLSTRDLTEAMSL